MMKHDCDVIRDLMPMCIDNTASENSRQMVGEHVLECKKCMEIYQEMRTEVPKEPPVSKEAQPFTTTVRKLRKKHRNRRVIIGIIGALLGIMIFLAAGFAYTRLTNDYARVAEDEDYGFQLARRTNGQIVMTHFNYNGRRQDARWSFDETTGILKLYAVTPTWALKTNRTVTPYLYQKDFYWNEAAGQLMIRRTDPEGKTRFDEVKEVWKGAKFKGNGYVYEILYVQGNDIPLATADMDAGYVLTDAEYTQDGLLYYTVVDGIPNVTVPPTAMPPVQAFSTPTPAPDEEEKARWDEDAAAEIAYIEAMENATTTPRPMVTLMPNTAP